MKNYNTTRLVIVLVVAFIAIIYFLNHIVFKKGRKIDSKFITRSAIFASIATILYIVPFFKFPLPIFPGFLEIHFDEVPLLIAGFAYGPWSAIFALIVKTIIKLPVSNTMFVGEVADLIYSAFFILPAAIIYKRHRNIKGALVGLLVGMVSQIIAASFITTFVVLDIYVALMPGLTHEGIIGMCKAVGINIDNLQWPFLYAVGIPFNALKDAMIVVLTLVLYKRLHTFVEKIS